MKLNFESNRTYLSRWSRESVSQFNTNLSHSCGEPVGVDISQTQTPNSKHPTFLSSLISDPRSLTPVKKS